MNTQSLFNILSRNQELNSLRQGVIMREAQLQKREFQRVLRQIKKANGKSQKSPN